MLPLCGQISRHVVNRIVVARSSLRTVSRVAGSNASRQYGPVNLSLSHELRCTARYSTQSSTNPLSDDTLKTYKETIDVPQATCSISSIASNTSQYLDQEITVHGYLGSRRDASKKLTFAELHDTRLQTRIQLVATSGSGQNGLPSTREVLQGLSEHIPVAVKGVVKARNAPPSDRSRQNGVVENAEIMLHDITQLNSFDESIILRNDTVFRPDQRHLQLRNESPIREALAFRSKASFLIRDELCNRQQFTEVETPILFKSTPEGAREFLVPTRNRGLAYALPQSPQQYKQILMASGIERYMQIARCFRDEDLRADRQPEFTQVDLEMSFATASNVMHVIEKLVIRLWKDLLHIDIAELFPRITYYDAMAAYGSDKPDLRLKSEIQRIDEHLPADLIGKIGPLTSPAVDGLKISPSQNPRQSSKFVSTFMDSVEAQPFIQNPAGEPGIFVVDSKRPLYGLHPFGFEAAEQMQERFELEDGDVFVIQARPDEPFSGGSTALGQLRLALHRSAVEQGLLERPTGFAFTWVTDFPLFTPSNENEPGQGGRAGFSSTHHPFTSPKRPEDVDLLLTDPSKVIADHYDLVVNGVELGGGSRRIHNAAMQELVMRQVLQMSDERIPDFAHLLDVLRAGCPPHAGIALGLDRLIAVMLDRASVRDVIAFPKSGRGEDMLVKSPTQLTAQQLSTYHLQIVE